MSNSKNQSLLEKWESLTFADDFIFCKVMQDEQLCKELLKLLLNIDVERIEYVNNQNTIALQMNSKGVRLDVYVKGSDRVFDIEMQTKITSDLPKRVRYYQSSMDLDILEKGDEYRDLKETFIVFICTHDPIGNGLPVYTFKNICLENKEIILNDQTNKIFFNANAYSDEENPNVKDFLEFIKTGKAKTDFTHKLEEHVVKAKKNITWRDDFMTMNMKLREYQEEGYNQGLSDGVAQGSHDAKVETAIRMMQKNCEFDFISDITGLSIEEIQKLK